jgi:hypothetical protein
MEGQYHSLIIDPGCKTALTGLRTDGTIWEYDISVVAVFKYADFKKD